MNRREFFGSLAVGGLTLVGTSVILNFLTGSPPIEWTLLEPDGTKIVYRFYKGPDYTTLEKALPYMQDTVGNLSDWRGANRVVMLQSVTFGSKVKKT